MFLGACRMTEWHLAPRGFSASSEEVPCHPPEFRIPLHLCRFAFNLNMPVA
jgi:hypothetical protein